MICYGKHRQYHISFQIITTALQLNDAEWIELILAPLQCMCTNMVWKIEDELSHVLGLKKKKNHIRTFILPVLYYCKVNHDKTKRLHVKFVQENPCTVFTNVLNFSYSAYRSAIRAANVVLLSGAWANECKKGPTFTWKLSFHLVWDQHSRWTSETLLGIRGAQRWFINLFPQHSNASGNRMCRKL